MSRPRAHGPHLDFLALRPQLQNIERYENGGAGIKKEVGQNMSGGATSFKNHHHQQQPAQQRTACAIHDVSGKTETFCKFWWSSSWPLGTSTSTTVLVRTL
jgi:hypothetical protein